MAILKNPFERAEALQKTNGHWIVASLATNIGFPRKAQTVHYDGLEFLLLPEGPAWEKKEDKPPPPDMMPAIAIDARAHRISDAQARSAITRFASAVAWQEGRKFEITHWTGGNLPRQMGKGRGRTVSDYLDADDLPSPQNEAARTALALYREGISLDNPFYAFLSLYKAFSVAVAPAERRAWLSREQDIREMRARERLAALKNEGENIGDYLHKQGRHAIAHADREPFVNPDSTDDHFRLAQDVPLMRAYTELAIEEAFGVLKPHTLYQQHLYELEGFRRLIPPGVLAAVKNDECVPVDLSIGWPRKWLVLAARGAEQFPIDGMVLGLATWCAGRLSLRFDSPGGVVQLTVALEFAEERLRFHPLGSLLITPDRATKRGIDEELQALRLQLAILSNGYLELWDAADERRLGRSEVFIPNNASVNVDWFRGKFAELEQLRKTADGSD